MPNAMPKMPDKLNACLPVILPDHRDAAQRIGDARQKPRLRASAEIPGILAQQAGEHSVTEEILRSKIAHRRAESLGISHAAFAIFGVWLSACERPALSAAAAILNGCESRPGRRAISVSASGAASPGLHCRPSDSWG